MNRSRTIVIICAALLGAGGCSPTRPGTAPEAQNLPPFAAADAILFDDTIAPEVFGLPLQSGGPMHDPKLAERSLRSDLIAQVRVSTVTADTGTESRYHVIVTASGPPLVGQPPAEPIELLLGPTSPSLPFVRAADVGFIGRTILLFARWYNDGGRVALHWRAEADTQALRETVPKVRALDEMGAPRRNP